MRRRTTRVLLGAGLVLVVAPLAFSRNRGQFPQIEEARSIDGTGNNIANPLWGAADTPLVRETTVAYGDGTGTPSGTDRPGARAISNAVMSQPGPVENTAGASSFVWQWGQFVDHDIDLTPILDPAEPFDIPVPAGDGFFDPFGSGNQFIPLDRSYYETVDGVREQVNDITAFIDASNVYGSDPVRAAALQSDARDSRLRTSAGNMLPFNTAGLPNAPSSDPSYFLAGDFRANEQIGLTALHTLFVREHNHWVTRIHKGDRRHFRALRRRMQNADTRPARKRTRNAWNARDGFTSDECYECARAIVAAEIQWVTYNEFLPALLGPDALAPYQGYDPGVDPSIRNVFSTAAYRVGHTMLPATLLRRNRRGKPTQAGDLALVDAFFAPHEILENGGIEPILRGLAAQPAQQVDIHITDAVRNFLFGPPGAGGFDLAALNIQRGRDHGLPSYNQVRRDFGLSPAATFADISSDADVQARLAAVYDDVEQIDPWVGGLAEDHVPGAMVGETFFVVIKRQFEALRDGDRFWYRRSLPAELVELVERQTLAGIIRRNTRIRGELPDDVFRVR